MPPKTTTINNKVPIPQDIPAIAEQVIAELPVTLAEPRKPFIGAIVIAYSLKLNHLSWMSARPAIITRIYGDDDQTINVQAFTDGMNDPNGSAGIEVRWMSGLTYAKPDRAHHCLPNTWHWIEE